MQNPFYFRVLPVTAPFCNREKELDQLVSHAQNRANVVLFSPRRYGKTSLVQRVQERLKQKGLATVYIDLFGIDSLEDMGARMASRLYSYCHKDESLFKKAMAFLSFWRSVIRPDPEYGVSLTVEPSESGGRESTSSTAPSMVLGNSSRRKRRGFRLSLMNFRRSPSCADPSG